MNVPQIVESCHRKSWHIRREIGVVRPDDLCHERRHAVGVDRQAVHRGEHMAGLGPGVAESQLIRNLAAAEGTARDTRQRGGTLHTAPRDTPAHCPAARQPAATPDGGIASRCGERLPGGPRPVRPWNPDATRGGVAPVARATGRRSGALAPGGRLRARPLRRPIAHAARLLSLSLRLFGNIFGEELVIVILASLVPFLVPLPMMFLGLLTATLQALIFAVLTMVYLGGAVAVEHHDEAHH